MARLLTIGLGAVLGALIAMTAPGFAQNEQFFPSLVYRSGAYAPNGIPFANGVADYYKLLNARDGGINGVKIVSEECETGYATDRASNATSASRARARPARRCSCRCRPGSLMR